MGGEEGLENRSNELRCGGEVLVAGMRQQVGVGGKSGPSLQASKGGAGGPHPPRERAWGAEEVGGGRGRRRLTGPTGPSESRQDLAPVVSATESGQGTGEGTGQGRGGRRTLLSPPTSRLGPRWSPAPVPQCWPRLLRGSLPGHAASARTAGRIRVPPRPTVERGGGTVRQRSMRATRVWGRAARRASGSW